MTNTTTTQEKLLPWTDLLAYVLQDDLHNRLTPRVIDIAYTAFMLAKQPNKEDGGDSDWFNDTKPAIKEAINKLRADLFADREKSRTPPAEQPAEGMTDAMEVICCDGEPTTKEECKDCGQWGYRKRAIRVGHDTTPEGTHITVMQGDNVVHSEFYPASKREQRDDDIGDANKMVPAQAQELPELPAPDLYEYEWKNGLRSRAVSLPPDAINIVTLHSSAKTLAYGQQCADQATAALREELAQVREERDEYLRDLGAMRKWSDDWHAKDAEVRQLREQAERDAKDAAQTVYALVRAAGGTIKIPPSVLVAIKESDRIERYEEPDGSLVFRAIPATTKQEEV